MFKTFTRKLISSVALAVNNKEMDQTVNILNSAAKKVSPIIVGKYMNLDLPYADFQLNIGEDVIFRNYCSLTIGDGAILSISDKVFFNNYCSINCLKAISIGENTLFGEGVKLYDHNHEYHYKNGLNVQRETFKSGFIKIGKNCWIGSNVTILNNVEIGDDVIIGANTLIYKSIPPGVIVKSKTEYIVNNLDGK